MSAPGPKSSRLAHWAHGRDQGLEDGVEAACRYLEAEAAALEADAATVCKTRAAKELLFLEAQVLHRYADKLRAGKHHEAEGDLG